MNPASATSTSLIGKCLGHIRGRQLTEYLRGYAAEIVIISRIMGPRAAGISLGKEIFGIEKPISPTPVLRILAMVESGEIPMTRERLKAVVDQDEGATRFFAEHPWLIDPTGKTAPVAKKGRKPLSQSMSMISEPEESKAGAKNEPKLSKNVKKRVASVSEVTELKTSKAQSDKNPWKEIAEKHDAQTKNPKPNVEDSPQAPKFVGPKMPPLNSTAEIMKQWQADHKQAVEEYREMIRPLGFKIPDDWDGKTCPSHAAVHISKI